MGSANGTTKRKKPPACDRCKAKRVLCHPDPNGCPRCLEKGFECRTTPVQRRKRRRSSHDREDHQPSEELPSGPASPVMARLPDPPVQQQPPPVPPVASSYIPVPLPDPRLPTAASGHVPTAEAANGFYPSPAWAAGPLNDNPATFRTDASTSQAPPFALPTESSSSWALLPAAGLRLTSELAMHLYESFRQSPHYDEPLIRFSNLYAALTASNWHVDLLSPQTRALALACLTIGALFSYDARIIGPSGIGGFAGIKWKGEDLRPYGRRRRLAFERIREMALRAAREVDATLEPSVDNAAMCYMLDIATQIGGETKLRALGSRPFLRAYYSHIYAIISSGGAPLADKPGRGMWAIHLVADMCTELSVGKLTVSLEEQELLTGNDSTTFDEVKEHYRHLLAQPVGDEWPGAKPLCTLFLATARSLVADVLGPHNRERKLDIAVLSKAVQSVVDMHAISLLHRQVWERFVTASTPPSSSSGGDATQDGHNKAPSPLFQHANARRVRWPRILAAKGVRHFGMYAWTPLVAPLVREVCRRANDLLNENATPEEVSSLTDERAANHRLGGGGNGYASGAGDSFSRELKNAQMAFLVRQVRALVPVAVEAHLTGMEDMPIMGMLSLVRETGVLQNFELYTELIERGDLPRDSRTAKLAHGAIQMLKTGGWTYASHEIDTLIDALEAIAGPDLHTPTDSLDVSYGSGAASTTSPSQQQEVYFPPQDAHPPPANNLGVDSTTFVPPPPPPPSFHANGSAALQPDYGRATNVQPESLSPGWLFAAANLATGATAANSTSTSLGLDDHTTNGLDDDVNFVADLDQSGALFGGAGWATGGIGAAALDATLFGGLAAFAGPGTGAGWSPPPPAGGAASQTGRAQYAPPNQGSQAQDWASRSPGT